MYMCVELTWFAADHLWVMFYFRCWAYRKHIKNVSHTQILSVYTIVVSIKIISTCEINLTDQQNYCIRSLFFSYKGPRQTLWNTLPETLKGLSEIKKLIKEF